MDCAGFGFVLGGGFRRLRFGGAATLSLCGVDFGVFGCGCACVWLGVGFGVCFMVWFVLCSGLRVVGLYAFYAGVLL